MPVTRQAHSLTADVQMCVVNLISGGFFTCSHHGSRITAAAPPSQPLLFETSRRVIAINCRRFSQQMKRAEWRRAARMAPSLLSMQRLHSPDSGCTRGTQSLPACCYSNSSQKCWRSPKGTARADRQDAVKQKAIKLICFPVKIGSQICLGK